MLFTQASIVIGLSALGSSHMIMNTPVPYGKSTLNNSPLAADGSDYPCKQRSGVYDTEGANNEMAIGSTQALKFTGSATHGGGSCQVSVTYDENPTSSSTFKVIHSIEGGCPIIGVAGNNGDDANAVDPSTYNFTIPSSLPTGNATLAWTWFNKIGNREMYMNCAPVTITGGSSSKRDTAAYDALPDILVANVGNGCTSVDSADLKFPNPGDSLEQLGTSTATPSAPTGSCATASAGGASASGSTGGSSVVTSAPAATSAAVVASSAAGSAAGGVFATSAAAVSSAASQATGAASVASSAVVSSPVASASTASSTGTTTSGSGTAFAQGTACTTEGEWNCIGGTQFQQCASGEWSAVQSVASGTTCVSGESSTYQMNVTGAKGKGRRSIRFSQDHVKQRNRVFRPEDFHA